MVMSRSRFWNARRAPSVVLVLVVLVWYDGRLCGVRVVPGVVRKLVVRKAHCGQPAPKCAWFRSRPVVQRVIPFWCGSPERRLCRCGTRMVWSAHAGGKMKESNRSAEHGVAVDRFARKIVRFLRAFPGALAATERQPVPRLPSHPVPLLFLFLWDLPIDART